MFGLKTARKVFLLTSACLLAGCAPPPLFNVQLLRTQTDYNSEGEAEQCAATYIEFVGQEEDLFLFYVEVEGISEDPITVIPAKSILR